MITMRHFMEAVDYRITEGSDYGWNCYGHNAYQLDSWDGDNDDGYSIGIVFDRVTQLVYQMDAHDYKNSRAYRWIHPDYKKKNDQETRERMIDADEAWDDVRYVDLEVADDMLEKARAIASGRDYDTRVQIPLDIDDSTLLGLFMEAHRQDITLNELVCRALEQEIRRVNNGQYA